MSDPWLVVVDPQRIFADPDSPWGSPMFGRILDPVRRLVDQQEGRVIVTRWLPVPPPRPGSWAAYFEAWPFADRPADDPAYDVVPDLADVAGRAAVVDATTFGKWDGIRAVTGEAPALTLTGVSTDCCVIATALAAADAGATVRVVGAACAGSTPVAHDAALLVMGQYAPQIVVV